MVPEGQRQPEGLKGPEGPAEPEGLKEPEGPAEPEGLKLERLQRPKLVLRPMHLRL